VGEPNERHHREPAYFLNHGYWERIKISVFGALIVGCILWSLGNHSWQMIFILLILSQSNQIHAWAHQGRHTNGPIITFFQQFGFLQSTKHHAKHHLKPHTKNYCVLTNWLNPVLNKSGFWTTLEDSISIILRIEPVK
jgi:plasmanylethanolamine desaturase